MTTTTDSTTAVATEPTNRAAWIEWRAAQLVAAGIGRRAADKRAAREWTARSPQHRAAVARRLSAADARYEATGDLSAYNRL